MIFQSSHVRVLEQNVVDPTEYEATEEADYVRRWCGAMYPFQSFPLIVIIFFCIHSVAIGLQNENIRVTVTRVVATSPVWRIGSLSVLVVYTNSYSDQLISASLQETYLLEFVVGPMHLDLVDVGTSAIPKGSHSPYGKDPILVVERSTKVGVEVGYAELPLLLVEFAEELRI